MMLPIISRRQSSNTGYQLDTTIDSGPRTIGFKITDPSANCGPTWRHAARPQYVVPHRRRLQRLEPYDRSI